MISEYSIKELQTEKRKLQAELTLILNSPNCSSDNINELKSEILHIEKEIKKKVGSKELKRQEEVKRKNKDDINLKNFKNLKAKYNRIKSMNVATKKFINIIDSLSNVVFEDEMIKVKR